jgi:diaminohydroxyphosphoribosylaminopyrimidine deaminase/5-amino-6-(5-phosphoribosylamino)uracil reductase
MMGMASQVMLDQYYMRMALSLAARGTGCVSPNPRVGCVLVRDGHVVGKGFHQCCGGPHAEVEALARAEESAQNSTAYVTLEPCSHYGKTPPCAPRLVEAGIARVVIGTDDPNPEVNGKGIALLKEAGVEVVRGVLETECRWMNRGFFRVMTLGRPWITVKAAASLDGAIALVNGESRWITCAASRRAGHLLRSEHDAILTGKGTVLADDPELSVRAVPGFSPRVVVLDSFLEIPPHAKVLRRPGTILACTEKAPVSRERVLCDGGAEVLRLPAINGRVDLVSLFVELARRGILSVLVEAGGEVVASCFRQKLADHVSLFLAPRIMGVGKRFSGSLHFTTMEGLFSLEAVTIRTVGNDYWLEGRPACSPVL